MKKVLLLTIIVFNTVFLNAQSDIIYTSDSGNIIFNCKIIEVKNGNNVYYVKDSISDSVVAIAITKDGNYIDLTKYTESLNKEKKKSDLYKEHNYNYYKKLYLQSKSNANLGKFFTIFGLGFNIVGAVMYFDNDIYNDDIAITMSIGGFVLFNVGLPVWIINGTKANNNRRAMELSRVHANLSFCYTKNGIGLTFHF